MKQSEKATRFAKLHVKGSPLILYNAWDAGSAKAIAESGAKAIATSSWSVAAAQGFDDGEVIPLDLVEEIAARVVSAVDVPVTVDFEGGYSEDDKVLAKNITRLIDVGVIGINFEDRIVQGSGLYSPERQAQRIAAIRKAASKRDVELFINARTDSYFLAGKKDLNKVTDEVLAREKLYAEAGASGLFIPGLTDEALIQRVAKEASLPVNVMVMDGLPSNARLAKLGVGRISYGPIPYIQIMSKLTEQARKVLGG